MIVSGYKDLESTNMKRFTTIFKKRDSCPSKKATQYTPFITPGPDFQEGGTKEPAKVLIAHLIKSVKHYNSAKSIWNDVKF